MTRFPDDTRAVAEFWLARLYARPKLRIRPQSAKLVTAKALAVKADIVVMVVYPDYQYIASARHGNGHGRFRRLRWLRAGRILRRSTEMGGKCRTYK